MNVLKRFMVIALVATPLGVTGFVHASQKDIVKLPSADIAGTKTSVATVQGQEVTIGASVGVKVNDATVTAPDIETSNGVVHAIDTVIMPKI